LVVTIALNITVIRVIISEFYPPFE
jgi:hypothetical protein